MLYLIVPHYLIIIGKSIVIPNYLIKNLSFNFFGQELICDAWYAPIKFYISHNHIAVGLYFNITKMHLFFKKQQLWLFSIMSFLYSFIRNLSIGYRKLMQIRGVGFGLNFYLTTVLFDIGQHDFYNLIIQQEFEIFFIKPQKRNIFGFIANNKSYVKFFCYWVRKFKKPDIYRGKGICFYKEKMLFKVGKKLK